MDEPVISSVTHALDKIGFGRFQWLLLCYCGLAWLADACEVMLLSFLGPAIHCAWGVGPGEESLLTSVVFCGMLAGVYSLGVTSDYVGRRRGFLASALLLGAAGLASALAPSFGGLLALRAVVGFALGGTPIAVTIFAETCTSAGRGRWLLLMQSFWTLGTVLEAMLAWAVLPSLGWRWLLALSATPLLALLALFPWLPESPHWLVAKGRFAEAEAVISRIAAVNRYSRPLRLRLSAGRRGSSDEHEGLALPGAEEVFVHSSSEQHGSSGSLSLRKAGQHNGTGTQVPSSPEVPLLQPHPSSNATAAAHGQSSDGNAAGISGAAGAAAHWQQRSRRLAQAMSAAASAVFSPQLRRTTLLLYCIWFVNAVSYYGLVLLTTALQTARKKEPCTPSGGPNLDGSDFSAILITTLAEAPGLAAAALLIDGPGRRRTLQAGLAVCAVALGALIADPPRGGQLALLFAARACIEGTFSVLYIYTPELYATSVRSMALALCNGFSRFGGFLAPYFTVYLVEQGHAHTAEALLGGLCGGAALCALMLPFETRGRDLQAADLHRPESAADGGAAGSALQQGPAADDGGGAEPDGVHVHGGTTAPTADGESELVDAHEHHDLAAAEGRPLLPG